MRVATAVATSAAAAVVLLTSWEAGQRAGSPAAGGVQVLTRPSPSTTTVRPSGTRPRAIHGAGAAPAVAERSITGALVQTQYGNVQVRVTLRGTRILDVVAVHLTDSSDTSVRISSGAAPTLRSEALRAQSANIDMVSGATYTSEGYKTSLQSALDAAHASG